MTRIVKNAAVVESRPIEGEEAPFAFTPLPPVITGGVLKRQVLAGEVSFRQMTPLPTRDTYADELNRLRVEITQAKEELKLLGRSIEEAHAEEEQAAAQREAALMSGEEVELTATEIIADAEREAAELLAQARADSMAAAEEARNNGYLEGFSKGYEEANTEFRKEYGPKMQVIEDILDRLAEYEHEAAGKYRENMVELAITIAKKLIGQKMDAEPAMVAELLRNLVTENAREEYIKISLSPDLMPVQAKAGEKVRALLTGLGANVTVVTDALLPEGSAWVETPKGVVDVSISTQLNNLRAAALEE